MKRVRAVFVHFCCACSAVFRSHSDNPESCTACRSVHWNELKRYSITQEGDDLHADR